MKVSCNQYGPVPSQADVSQWFKSWMHEVVSERKQTQIFVSLWSLVSTLHSHFLLCRLLLPASVPQPNDRFEASLSNVHSVCCSKGICHQKEKSLITTVSGFRCNSIKTLPTASSHTRSRQRVCTCCSMLTWAAESDQPADQSHFRVVLLHRPADLQEKRNPRLVPDVNLTPGLPKHHPLDGSYEATGHKGMKACSLNVQELLHGCDFPPRFGKSSWFIWEGVDNESNWCHFL